jgi:RNA polymerase sigma-B factor
VDRVAVRSTDAFADYRRTRDTRLRDRLVEDHVHLAYWIAQRFTGHGVDIDDLRQTALLALFKAVERFDPEYGVKFATYATPTILGELKRHLRDHRWAVRPPRAVQDRALELTRIVEDLTHRLGRSPTIAEIAEASSWDAEHVLEAMEASGAYTRTPHDLSDTENAGFLAVSDRGLDDVENSSTVELLLRALPERQRNIVVWRYFGGESQQTIARRLGVSQMQISRLLTRSLHELKLAAEATGVLAG